MIYTDNGSREAPLEEIDLLTLAADQVGLAIENEFLRSRLAADCRESHAAQTGSVRVTGASEKKA